MIQLTRHGAVVSGSAADLEVLRRRFDREHCLRLPKLVGSEVLALLQPMLEAAVFRPQHYEEVGSELRMQPNVADDLLHFLANDPKLYAFVRQVAGCGRVGCFSGRIYRMVSTPGHAFVWHDDMVAGRMAALSINLSAQAYSGGLLEIRDAKSKEFLYRSSRLDWGDALLIRVAERLEHRVTPLEGDAPKTAFAGWFQSQPDFYALLRERRAAQQESDAGKPGEPAERRLVGQN